MASDAKGVSAAAEARRNAPEEEQAAAEAPAGGEALERQPSGGTDVDDAEDDREESRGPWTPEVRDPLSKFDEA